MLNVKLDMNPDERKWVDWRNTAPGIVDVETGADSWSSLRIDSGFEAVWRNDRNRIVFMIYSESAHCVTRHFLLGCLAIAVVTPNWWLVLLHNMPSFETSVIHPLNCCGTETMHCVQLAAFSIFLNVRHETSELIFFFQEHHWTTLTLLQGIIRQALNSD